MFPSFLSFLLIFKELCPWCRCLLSPMSVTPPFCVPQRLTFQTSGRPGSVSEAPGSTRSSGPYRPSWVGAATAPRDLVLPVLSSGTSAQPPVSHMCCVSSSSVCCCPFCSWSTHMAEFWSQSRGWVRTDLHNLHRFVHQMCLTQCTVCTSSNKNFFDLHI